MGRKRKTDGDNPLVIPFGKAARVGNFKVWRGNYAAAGGKDGIECVHVSNLDGSWMVRIPSTSTMYGFICSQYATVDENIRENILGMVFTNMANVCSMSSPALHDGFMLLTEMMTFPYLLLPEKEMERRMKTHMEKLGVEKGMAKEHLSKMMGYRKELYDLVGRKMDAFIEDYERQMDERAAKEPDEEKKMEQDDIAEQAVDILSEDNSNTE